MDVDSGDELDLKMGSWEGDVMGEGGGTLEPGRGDP